MVCCALMAAILGLFTWVIKAFSSAPSPLAWRGNTLASVPSPPFTLSARARSFAYAWAGIRFVVGHEHNMRIHIVAAGIAVASGFLLKIDMNDWRWIALAIGLVLAAETFNTAIEQACNALGGGHNESVRIAKDAAAGAVLLCCGLAVVIGALVFVPHLAFSATPEAFDISRVQMCRSVAAR